MKEIPLTQGRIALVDDEDYCRVSAHKWNLMVSRVGRSVRFYAVCTEIGQLLHQFILGTKSIDHANGDGLDNRKQNLRPCSQGQNLANRTGYGETGFKGVYPRRRSRGYRAQIGGKHLGSFATPPEAALAFDAAAREKWGEFGTFNFPRPGERSAITGEIVPAVSHSETQVA